MSEWIKCTDQLPPLSFCDSDNPNDYYGPIPVIVWAPYPWSYSCVACLCKDNDEDSNNFGEYYWDIYIPFSEHTDEIDFDTFTLWMPLNKPPGDL